jgi:tetratricopeptide (TPR) repeat protein
MAWPQELAVSQLRAWDTVCADRRAAEARGETDRAGALREEEAEARDTATEAVSSAITSWYALVEGFENAKGTDEALFQLGRDFEYLADLSDDPAEAESDRFKARTVLQVLIRNWPVSDRLAGAWLSFGDVFAEQDDCPRALDVYDRVLQLDVPLLRGYTLYRKARCLRQLGRDDEAREALYVLLAWLNDRPDAVGADELREALCREPPFP